MAEVVLVPVGPLSFLTVEDIDWDNRKSPEALLKWLEKARFEQRIIRCEAIRALDTTRHDLSIEEAVRAVVELRKRSASEKAKEYHRRAGHGDHPPDCDVCFHHVQIYAKRGGLGGHRRVRDANSATGFRILKCDRAGTDGISVCGCTTYVESSVELTGRRR